MPQDADTARELMWRIMEAARIGLRDWDRFVKIEGISKAERDVRDLMGLTEMFHLISGMAETGVEAVEAGRVDKEGGMLTLWKAGKGKEGP